MEGRETISYALAETAKPIVALVGNPNVGKSVIFSRLTGHYAIVANYPGTTVDVLRSDATIGGRDMMVVDTPGTNHLVGGSEDERITREVLLAHRPDLVVQVADAKNLRRSLLLASQLIEARVPLVIALNMKDEADARGVRIDAEKLSALLGMPVISTTAVTGEGLEELKTAIADSLNHRTSQKVSTHSAELESRASHGIVIYDEPIEQTLREMEQLLPPKSAVTQRSLALMFLASDHSFDEWLKTRVDSVVFEKLTALRAQLQKKFPEPLNFVLNHSRLLTVDRWMAATYFTEGIRAKDFKMKVGYWAMQPLKGSLILAIVLYAAFWFVGLLGAGMAVDFFETVVFGQWVNPLVIKATDAVLPFPHERQVEELAWHLEIPLTPIHSMGTGVSLARKVPISDYVIPDSVTLTAGQKTVRFFNDFLVGNYGAVTMALSYGLAIVLPIVTFFFLIFSMLEDTGYLPRLAILVNRIFRTMGLNGKAVLPMILGLGCDTMATMTARILETKKDRLITTILLALAVPCSAQLGVLMALMAKVSPLHVLIWGIVVVAVMLTVGFLAARVLPGESSDFVLEIPPMRMPQIGNVATKTFARVRWYLKEVIPLFVLGTAILFLLDRVRALDWIARAAQPIVSDWLGLPVETANAFLIGFLRRDYGAVYLLDAATGADRILNNHQILVAMITVTLFVPCVANIFVIIREQGTKVAAAMVVFIFPFAFFVGGVVNHLTRLLGL